MNVTCASLLSRVDEPDWPTADHVRESWVLSRQCALLGDTNEGDEIVDLPEQLSQLLSQDAGARPRAVAFGVAAFKRPISDDWSFLKELHIDADLVQSVVRAGPGALRDRHCPFLRLGRLFEIEETTIEQLLTLNHLLRDYASRRLVPRPLSIGVFGPAGSGKSFSLAELARSAGLPLDPVFLSYNLSQLRSVKDLDPALHAVQSAVLRGNLPVVFWDEFDATIDGRPLGWVKYFLGPMQDGEFFVRGAAHPLGRSVFVFVGATAHTFAAFGSRDDQDSKDAKLSDFVSRIKAWLERPAACVIEHACRPAAPCDAGARSDAAARTACQHDRQGRHRVSGIGQIPDRSRARAGDRGGGLERHEQIHACSAPVHGRHRGSEVSLKVWNPVSRTPFRKSHGKITLVLYNKHYWCGGKCLYCFVAKGFTRSTSGNEDTILARDCDWDPVCQLGGRLRGTASCGALATSTTLR